LWDSIDGMQDLNDLLDASSAGWTIYEARAINEHGQIAAYGRSPSGQNHAVLLNPVPVLGSEIPEPMSLVAWSVLAVCGCTIAFHRRRVSGNNAAKSDNSPAV
jgi:hypothetical protein